MFKIEKNVPIPNNFTEYPFVDMEIGDSFFVKAENEKKIASLRTLINNKITSFNRNLAIKEPLKKFSVRKDGMGIRVWRLK